MQNCVALHSNSAMYPGFPGFGLGFRICFAFPVLNGGINAKTALYRFCEFTGWDLVVRVVHPFFCAGFVWAGGPVQSYCR